AVRARRCSRMSPWRARTPTTGSLTARLRPETPRTPSPATLGQTVRDGDVVHVDADHGLTQAARNLGDHVGVVVERRGLDDRRGALGGITGLEDARSDEDPL